MGHASRVSATSIGTSGEIRIVRPNANTVKFTVNATEMRIPRLLVIERGAHNVSSLCSRCCNLPSFGASIPTKEMMTTTTMAHLRRSSLALVASLALAAAFSRPTFVTRSRTASRLRATYDYALLFDCDGVILETEELHRIAYNAAFAEFDLTIDDKPVVWEVRVP